jgi:hypothetical protein
MEQYIIGVLAVILAISELLPHFNITPNSNLQVIFTLCRKCLGVLKKEP